MTLHSERGESNKTNAKKVLYKASYEVPLTKKTRHESLFSKDFVSRDFLKKQRRYYTVSRRELGKARDFLPEIFFQIFSLRDFFWENVLTDFIWLTRYFLISFFSRCFLQEIFFKTFRRFLKILPWWTSWNLVSSYTKNVRSINAFFCYHGPGPSQVQQKEKMVSLLQISY